MKPFGFFLSAILFVCVFCSRTEAQYITTYAGNGTSGFAGDGGLATAAQIGSASGLFYKAPGILFIADQNGKIRKVDTSGIITTVAGNGTSGGSAGDGGPATLAQLSAPEGVTVDRYGNIYIADQFNNKIRKVDTAGIITTVAGDGTLGYTGDGGSATDAHLWAPADVGTDSAGNVYFADQDNSAIRKISTAGIISTMAGNGTAGYGGDGGPATAAQLNYPYSIFVDKVGTIYVADYYNSRIRKIDTAGIIKTVAGNGVAGSAGDGGPATNANLYYASAVTVDDSGNIFVGDFFGYRVRKVNVAGIISTVAGDGTLGYNGDCIPATDAEIYGPEGIAVDSVGNIFICDISDRVRKVTDSGCFITTRLKSPTPSSLKVFPNPTTGPVRIAADDNAQIISIRILNIMGQTVYETDVNAAETTIDFSGKPNGVYIIYIYTDSKTITQKIIYN